MRFQFKKVVPALTFVIAIICSFAFRSETKVDPNCVWFAYVGPQSAGNPATLAQARTKANWVRVFGTPSCDTGGYLCAICVTQIDPGEDEETGTADDLPEVDDSGDAIYSQFAVSRDPDTGTPATWSNIDHPGGADLHIATKTIQ